MGFKEKKIKYFVICYPTRPGCFCPIETGFNKMKFLNRRKAIQCEFNFKNGESWMNTVVFRINNEGICEIICGYISDIWENNKYIKGFRFKKENIPEYIEKKFNNFRIRS